MNKKLLLAASFCALFACVCFAGAKKSDNLEMIRSGLKDNSREIRELTAGTLGAVGDKTSVKTLKALISDPNENDSVKISAAVAVVKLGDRSGLAEIRKILANVPKLSENPKPFERARAIAKGTVRAQAARELGNLKDAESRGLLKRMVDDEDGRVADASLIALAKMGDPEGKKQFLSALESTKHEVRAKAAESLGEIRDGSAAVLLRKRLKDWDVNAKSAAVVALGKLQDKESLPAIKELLWDKDDKIREKAAEALGYMGDASVTPALEELLKDANGFVRFTAVESLYKLGQSSGKEFVLGALKAQENEAKLRALGILADIGTEKDIAKIEPLTRDADRKVSIAAAKAVVMIQSKEK